MLFVSCDENENLNLDQYVVNGFFSDKTPLLVHTAKARSLFDTINGDYPEVNDLEGSIYENGNYRGDLVYKRLNQVDFGYPDNMGNPSYQRFNLTGYTIDNLDFVQGNSYKIELIKNDEVYLSGEDIIPHEVDFEVTDTISFDIDPNELFYESDSRGLRCKIKINDPDNESNYYALGFSTINEIFTEEIFALTYCNDPIAEAIYFHRNMPCEGRILFSDKDFTEDNRSLIVDVAQIRYGIVSGELNVYLFSLSEKYYKYIKSTIKQRENNEDLYAEPVQIYDNIENGFGIFAGFTYHKETIYY